MAVSADVKVCSHSSCWPLMLLSIGAISRCASMELVPSKGCPSSRLSAGSNAVTCVIHYQKIHGICDEVSKEALLSGSMSVVAALSKCHVPNSQEALQQLKPPVKLWPNGWPHSHLKLRCAQQRHRACSNSSVSIAGIQ